MISRLRDVWGRLAATVSRPPSPIEGDRPGVPLLVEPGHFYSPIVDPKLARKHLDRLASKGAPSNLIGVEVDRNLMLSTWAAMVPYFATMPFTEDGSPSLRYRFDNDNYSWADGSVLHAMLRVHRPAHVIEIGSGWSSACMIDTAEMQPDAPCRFTFIEPYPKLLKDLVGRTDIDTCILESPVEDVDIEVFDQLRSGDFLFIDSTHVLKTGSDVAFELFEVLPRLPVGVIVHIHDMFWPFEYPQDWAVTQNRSWNEIYAVRAFLTQNEAWEIMFFNDYFASFERSRVEKDYEPFLRNSGGALWLRRKANA